MLTAYALSSVFLTSVFLIAVRKLPNGALISVGVAVFVLSVTSALLAQHIAGTTNTSLSGLRTLGEIPDQQIIGIPFMLGCFLRA